jgi:hypothetical protein
MKTTCLQCGTTGSGHYCSHCGQSLHTSRLTSLSIVHEIFHFFTHLDKGFPHTLKNLALRPGKMQKSYIEGHRSHYQRPFSMVFVCGTLAAFGLYLIHNPAGHLSPYEVAREEFIRHYYVLVQCVLLPLYALSTWLLFRNNKINYAESLVLFAYTLSFMLLMVIMTNLLDLLPDRIIHSYYYEIPVLFAYMFWTFYNFFSKERIWRLFLKSLVNILIAYIASNFVGDRIVDALQ